MTNLVSIQAAPGHRLRPGEMGCAGLELATEQGSAPERADRGRQQPDEGQQLTEHQVPLFHQRGQRVATRRRAVGRPVVGDERRGGQTVQHGGRRQQGEQRRGARRSAPGTGAAWSAPTRPSRRRSLHVGEHQVLDGGLPDRPARIQSHGRVVALDQQNRLTIATELRDDRQSGGHPVGELDRPDQQLVPGQQLVDRVREPQLGRNRPARSQSQALVRSDRECEDSTTVTLRSARSTISVPITSRRATGSRSDSGSSSSSRAGPFGQRHHQCDLRPLAAGQFADLRVERNVPIAKPIDRVRLVPGRVHPPTEPEQVRHPQAAVQRLALRDEPNPGQQTGRRGPGAVAQHGDRAGIGAAQTREHLQQGRLARTVPSDDGDHAALRNPQRAIREGPPSAVAGPGAECLAPRRRHPRCLLSLVPTRGPLAPEGDDANVGVGRSCAAGDGRVFGAGEQRKDVVLVETGVPGPLHPGHAAPRTAGPELSGEAEPRPRRTKVPTPGRGATRPSRSSSRYAFNTVFGLIANAPTTSLAVGNRSPGCSNPIRIPFLTC